MITEWSKVLWFCVKCFEQKCEQNKKQTNPTKTEWNESGGMGRKEKMEPKIGSQKISLLERCYFRNINWWAKNKEELLRAWVYKQMDSFSAS